MDNIRTNMCKLPAHVAGFTVVTDDYFTIFLNSSLTFERNLATYNHELQHILRGDFDKRTGANLIEIIAHAPDPEEKSS